MVKHLGAIFVFLTLIGIASHRSGILKKNLFHLIFAFFVGLVYVWIFNDGFVVFNPLNYIVYLYIYAMVLCEELTFRYVLMKEGEAFFPSKTVAIFTVAAVFALCHYFNLLHQPVEHTNGQVTVAFIMGLILYGCTRLFKNRLAGVIPHLLFNLTFGMSDWF